MAVAWSQGQGRPRLRRRDRARCRSCSPRPCRASCSPAIKARSASISTMSKARPASTRSASRPTVRSRSGRRSRRSASPASSAPASACRSARPPSASAMWRSASAGRTASPCSAATRSAAKPATQVLTRRTVRPIAKGESISLSSDLFADLVPGTGNVQLSVGPSTALDVAALLKALDRYPFGCSEQTTSRALPLLYVNELAAESQLSLDVAIDQRIRDAIERLLSRQGSNGSFGLWGAGRRRRLARRLRDRLPDAGARAQLRRAGRRVPPRARQSAQPRRRRTIPPRT